MLGIIHNARVVKGSVEWGVSKNNNYFNLVGFIKAILFNKLHSLWE